MQKQKIHKTLGSISERTRLLLRWSMDINSTLRNYSSGFRTHCLQKKGVRKINQRSSPDTYLWHRRSPWFWEWILDKLCYEVSKCIHISYLFGRIHWVCYWIFLTSTSKKSGNFDHLLCQSAYSWLEHCHLLPTRINTSTLWYNPSFNLRLSIFISALTVSTPFSHCSHCHVSC